MELSPKTKVDDLLTSYPFLLEFFIAQSPKFKLLQNPVTRKTIGKVATMGQVASIGGLDLNQLLVDTAAEISKHGEVVTAGNWASETVEALATEDRDARQEILKDIIRDLHDGGDMEALKRRFHELIRDIDASEIAAMEQALIAEGMPESEVKRLCDVHVEVFKESLEEQPAPSTAPGHPINTYMLENRAAEEIVQELSRAVEAAGTVGGLSDPQKDEIERLTKSLAAIDRHYLRKENQLFPILEGYEITGPSQVMWAIHDDIRDALKTALAELSGHDGRAAMNSIRYAVKSLDDMIYKEEHILFPMAVDLFTDADWQKVRQGEEEIGYAWIEPPGDSPVAAAVTGPALAATGLLQLDTGALTPAQVNLMLTHLPVELSFVDENDEVCYYTGLKHKIFPRSPGVIGRKVQNCHPPASLDKVQGILDGFRAGTSDNADFWIELKGRFIYIRYFAVRDADGTYRGTLEIVQDATGLRALTGQKRLPD